MMIRDDIAPSTMTIAVVRAADGMRVVANGRWGEDVLPALVCYVKQRADDVLWPGAAARVHASIEIGRTQAAIAEYFEQVGARWDDERLDIYVVRRDDMARIAAATVVDALSSRPRGVFI